MTLSKRRSRLAGGAQCALHQDSWNLVKCDQSEAMAVREPLLAKTLMLDTVQKDDQKREEFANATYGGLALDGLSDVE
jgi:hypothetical protein